MWVMMEPNRHQLRTLLRDPEKRIWSNDELDDMLSHGLCWWNMVTPQTSMDMIELRGSKQPYAGVQQSAVLWASVVLAVTHLLQPSGMKNDVDLDADQRVKYEELLANAEEKFDHSKTTKARIVRPETVWN